MRSRQSRRLSGSAGDCGVLGRPEAEFEQSPAAPTNDALAKVSGVHVKHAAYKNPQLIRFLTRLRRRELVFVHKERIWRQIADIHQSALRVIAAGERMTIRRLGASIKKSGVFRDPVSRVAD